MDNAAYAALSRQAALRHELQVVAHNLANAGTTGFRAADTLFAEHVRRVDGGPALAMTRLVATLPRAAQGALVPTGGPLDLAIEGEGWFRVLTPSGERLTRAGHFAAGPEGVLASPEGHALLDEGGAPILLPATARALEVAPDGTLLADGAPLARIVPVRPADPLAMARSAGTLFDPGGATEPAEAARIRQGFLEDSNVEPVAEIARLVELSRAYELGQGFLAREDERVRGVIRTLGR